MRCPHCGTDFHDDWHANIMLKDKGLPAFADRNDQWMSFWHYRTTKCSKCKDLIIEIAPFNQHSVQIADWRMVYPVSAARGPVPIEVPPDIAVDYVEACNVLAISSKASAALSRSCLQNMLHAAGYRGRNLAVEIEILFNEPDPKKGLPQKIRASFDAIRNLGNFSAHPIDDKTTLQIIDVEPDEAEWCLEIIEELFEHFYVGPAAAMAKKAALDAKLAAAGKPPSKG
jgi:hypothetical protein